MYIPLGFQESAIIFIIQGVETIKIKNIINNVGQVKCSFEFYKVKTKLV